MNKQIANSHDFDLDQSLRSLKGKSLEDVFNTGESENRKEKTVERISCYNCSPWIPMVLTFCKQCPYFEVRVTKWHVRKSVQVDHRTPVNIAPTWRSIIGLATDFPCLLWGNRTAGFPRHVAAPVSWRKGSPIKIQSWENSPTWMRVVIYLRVSTDEQTVENQLPILKAQCRSRDWDIIKIYQ